MNYNNLIDEAISGLKDFQSRTVDYVFDQLYNKNRHKMLVADEVGLGKTIVAKGIIAKAFKRYLENGGPTKDNPTFNVVYICSNLSLAYQNIRKLNFLKDKDYVDDIITRLTYLAYKPDDKPKIFLINALTPGTSFDQKSNLGERNERAIIYTLLTGYQPFSNRANSLKWILKGHQLSSAGWEYTLRKFNNGERKLRHDLYNKFRQELFNTEITENDFPKTYIELDRRTEKSISLWHALLRICDYTDGHNAHLLKCRGEIVSSLRRILSTICLEYLNADIFILDEFQRYSNLIKLDNEAESPAIKLARAIFKIPDAKILMLSATPFKPFTNDFDELNGEVHYKEFEAVLKFLMNDEADTFWNKFKDDRKTFFKYLREPEKLIANLQDAKLVKEGLECTYRNTIVRTERLIASEDRDALVHSVLKNKPLQFHPEDIEDFVNLDKITLHLNKYHNSRLPVPLEYVKSSPFVLSFLDNYQHKKMLAELIGEDPELKKLLRKTGHSWINLETIDQYKEIIPRRSRSLPNAKLRLLLEETVEKGGWKYLWIPPTIPYYPASGAFMEGKGYSKTLIFSSWLFVPRMVSAVVSYEAERSCIGNPDSISGNEKTEEKRNYFSARRTPRPQFTFKVDKEGGDVQQMSSMIYLFPSYFLAEIYDPLSNLNSGKTLNEVRSEIREKLYQSLMQVLSTNDKGKKADWQKWFWAAPLLLQRMSANSRIYKEWFQKEWADVGLAVDPEDETQQRDENSGKAKHFRRAAEVYLEPDFISLPELTQDETDQVLEFMTDLCLGSPAVCYLRTQLRYFGMNSGLLDNSFKVASGFVTLFNKPESIAVVRLTTTENEYLSRVLQYSIDGNIQSLLDEFVFLLRSCENLRLPDELAEYLTDVLSVRTSRTQVDDLDSFLKRSGETKGRVRQIRSHFAVDFGVQKVNTANTNGRQINIRQAFNSPFRPFVLASTSIGQEGLDFHLYCKKIFHWNLPSNPIDLEQREGRIHRYQGLVIRQNIADKYLDKIPANGGERVWENLFEIASAEKCSSRGKCEIVPYWHTETINNIKIERFVPLYPFSKDIEKYRNLIKILTFYRLTFGQPRQEELIDALYEGNISETLKENLSELIINLSPVKFYNPG